MFCAAELFTYIGFFEQNKAHIFFANTWPQAALSLAVHWLGDSNSVQVPFTQDREVGPRSGAQTGQLLELPHQPSVQPGGEAGGPSGPWPHSPWGLSPASGCSPVSSRPLCPLGNPRLLPDFWLKPPARELQREIPVGCVAAPGTSMVAGEPLLPEVSQEACCSYQ